MTTGPAPIILSMPRELNSLCHFAINALDTDRAVSFYEAVFGWRFQAWGPPGFSRTEVAGLHAAIQQKQDEPFPTVIGNFECSIAVDDVDRVAALIVENGGEITLPKVTIPGVCDLARVKDTEGNTFSIARYHTP
jgi:predicted enzyme related to lactoylglutathione lyase